MKHLRTALTFFMAGLILASCTMQPGTGESPDTATAEQRIQPVKVITLAFKETDIAKTVTSTVVAFEETHLSPALQGRIRSVKVDVNDHVKKGQLLAVMDRTQLDQTRLQLETLKTDLARMDTLLKTGSVTQQAYDQMQSQVETTELVLENLQENTLLRAPYDGIITAKYYNDGELFSPTPNTPAGKAALVSMVQINPVKVMANLSESLLPMIQRGMEATVQTDVYPGETFKGDVVRIHPTINPATRTFTVEVRVPNSQERLRPGMFARVGVKVGRKEALIVPAIAVLQTSGTNERYVMLHDNGQARKVVVNILNRYDDQLEIGSPGIQGGEQLIIAGQTDLEHGDPVKVVVE